MMGMTDRMSRLNQEHIAVFEQRLSEIGFHATKRITVLDFFDKQSLLSIAASKNADVVLTSGLWVDYESKRIALRDPGMRQNELALNTVADFKKTAEKLRAKHIETPIILLFSEISDRRLAYNT